jgi:hypothetical protein
MTELLTADSFSKTKYRGMSTRDYIAAAVCAPSIAASGLKLSDEEFHEMCYEMADIWVMNTRQAQERKQDETR